MRKFCDIMALASERHGGEKALKAALLETRPLMSSDIRAISDARILAAMTRNVFYAAFLMEMVDERWDAFELAFGGFDLAECARMSEDRIDELLQCKEIVRNEVKIRSVRANARFVLELAEEHGGAGRFFAEWPEREYVRLLDALKTRGNRLGGETGMRFLRSIGKAAFGLAPPRWTPGIARWS